MPLWPCGQCVISTQPIIRRAASHGQQGVVQHRRMPFVLVGPVPGWSNCRDRSCSTSPGVPCLEQLLKPGFGRQQGRPVRADAAWQAVEREAPKVAGPGFRARGVAWASRPFAHLCGKLCGEVLVACTTRVMVENPLKHEFGVPDSAASWAMKRMASWLSGCAACTAK